MNLQIERKIYSYANLSALVCKLSNFRRPLHSFDLAEIWHEVLIYDPNHEMDI